MAPTSVMIAPSTPQETKRSIFRSIGAISWDCMLVLIATLNLLFPPWAIPMAVRTSSSASSYWSRRRLHPRGPTYTAFAPLATTASTIARFPAGARSSTMRPSLTRRSVPPKDDRFRPPFRVTCLRLRAGDRQQRADRFRADARIVHSTPAEVEAVAETDAGMTAEGLPPAFVQSTRTGGGPIQGRPINGRDFAPVSRRLGNGLDPEMPVALGEKPRQVLQHAHVFAAQDPLPHGLHRPVPLLQEELFLAEIRTFDPPLLLVFEQEAVVRDSQRHLSVHEKLHGSPAADGDLVDLLQAQFVVGGEPHRAVISKNLDARGGVHVCEAPDVNRQLRELVVNDFQDPEVVDLDGLSAGLHRGFQHLADLRQEVVSRRRIRRHVSPLPLILKDAKSLPEIPELLQEIRLVDAAIDVAQVDGVVVAEVRRTEISKVRDRRVQFEPAHRLPFVFHRPFPIVRPRPRRPAARRRRQRAEPSSRRSLPGSVERGAPGA